MADFLNEEQVEKLTKIGYSVKQKMFRTIFYKSELPFLVWQSICEISGADINSNSVTLLSSAFKCE